MFKKIIILILVSIVITSCATSNTRQSTQTKLTGSYDLGLINATMSYDVLFYINGLTVGVSSVKMNTLMPTIIKSSSSSKFKIIGFTTHSLSEAVSSDNSTHAYLFTEFKVKEEALYKANLKILNGQIEFSDVLNSFNQNNDMIITEKGSKNAPNPKNFSVLRRANVYNIKIRDSKNKVYLLQICVEMLIDSSKL